MSIETLGEILSIVGIVLIFILVGQWVSTYIANRRYEASMEANANHNKTLNLHHHAATLNIKSKGLGE